LSDTDIFISYSRDDREIAKQFAAGLSEEGFLVWWDAALHSGETFDEVIEKQLKAAKAVVVLWSPRSVKSRWVRAEATLADRRDKLVPAIIEPCDRPIIFELAHTIDLSHWTGDREDVAWQRFSSDVARLVHRHQDEPDVIAEPNGRAAAEAAPVVNDPPPTSQVVEDEEAYEATQFMTAASSNTASHWLLHSNADSPAAQYVIGPLGLKIGRGHSSDVVLADSQISRTHCMVHLREDELHVVDLDSTNGTFVDDERIAEETILPVGSTLRIGTFSLVHQIRDPHHG
jgi:hypothetical protein